MTITIPPNAIEAGKDTAFSWLRSHMEDDVRVQHMTDEELTELVSAACLAMLRAWPGMTTDGRELHFSTARGAPVTTVKAYSIILPLPQKETSDNTHEFVSDWYRPARCVNCGQTRDHAIHKETSA